MNQTPPAPFTTPDWIKHAIVYQIFPDRFCNGDPTNDPANKSPWLSQPTTTNTMGGDLQGIINRLDYLNDLGITAIYLNPIFHASSNHKYNTYDYYQIDPHFGTLETFHTLVHQAHQRNIRIILDGVFNHCSRGFFAFHNLLEEQQHSPYQEWFHVQQFPLHPYNEAEPANYACWWNIRSLPKFNPTHPPVRDYLLAIARYWIEQGADGWRLDVPNEIKDHDFWREFRHTVKAANPDAYIVGEIWKDASPWLDGTQFDAVMNYLFRDLCRDFFARDTITIDTFAHEIAALLQRYPPEVTQAQLNLFGSHDTPRILTEAGGDLNRLYAATLFQMTYPGAPCIYYGDEIGLQGGKEPDSRGCFPWDESVWERELRDWVRQCARLRHTHTALRTGHFHTLYVSAPCYAFVRWNDEEQLIVALNTTPRPHTSTLPLGDLPIPATATSATDLLSGTTYPIAQEEIASLSIPGRRGVVLRLH